MKEPNITIPDAAWHPAGSEENERSRLIAGFEINGHSFHLMAYQVELVNDCHVLADDQFAREYAGFACFDSDNCFESQQISGREYLIVAYPHQP